MSLISLSRKTTGVTDLLSPNQILTIWSVSFWLTFNNPKEMLSIFDIWEKNCGNINVACFNKLDFVVRYCCFNKFIIIRSL